LKNRGGPDRLQAMNKNSLTLGTYCLILIIPIIFSSIAHGNESSAIPSFYQPLINRLLQDGFDSEFLSKLLTDSRAELNPGLMTISLESRETTELYQQFLSAESILLSKKFLRQNLQGLRKMEKSFMWRRKSSWPFSWWSQGLERISENTGSSPLLVIEDSEQNRYLMKFLLEKNGFRVVEAQSAMEGIEKALYAKYLAILLDIQLPDMDGYAVARKLRTVEELREIPIIAVTSYAMIGD